MTYRKRIVSLLLLWSAAAAANAADYAVRTNAMTCDYCAYDLEQFFLKMDGVTDFETDVDGILYIKTDSTLELAEPTVRRILLDHGFDYKGMREINK